MSSLSGSVLYVMTCLAVKILTGAHQQFIRISASKICYKKLVGLTGVDCGRLSLEQIEKLYTFCCTYCTLSAVHICCTYIYTCLSTNQQIKVLCSKLVFNLMYVSTVVCRWLCSTVSRNKAADIR